MLEIGKHTIRVHTVTEHFTAKIETWKGIFTLTPNVELGPER